MTKFREFFLYSIYAEIAWQNLKDYGIMEFRLRKERARPAEIKKVAEFIHTPQPVS